MSVAASPIPVQTDLPPLPLYRLPVSEFRQLISLGILGTSEPIEMLEGLLVFKGDTTLGPKVTALSCTGPNGFTYSHFDVPVSIRRFSVAEYHRMIETGILGTNDRLELLEGWLVRKMTRNPPHDAGISLLQRHILPLLPDEWLGRIQLGLTADFSEPEPDIAVVHGTERDFSRQHPRPRHVGLIVEVADTSLESDRALKGQIYSRVGIPTYWILNLVDGVLEVYTDPTGPDPNPEYRQRQDFGPDDIVPLVLNGQEVGRITVRDLLP